MSEWTAVADRLPLEAGRCIAFQHLAVLATDGCRVELCYFEAGTGAGKHWANWSQYNEIDSSRITHWMPLPEPPKC